jgi:hypothetical protein
MYQLIKAIILTILAKKQKPTLEFSQFIIVNKTNKAKMFLVEHVNNATM